MVNGQYRVVNKLGQGGYGSVYHVRQLDTNASVALKVERAGRDVLRNEFKVLKYLGERGARVPSVYDYWKLGNHSAMTMDLKGDNLKSLARTANGTLSVVMMSFLLVQMLGLLRQVHRSGYIHRDIRPQNIVCDMYMGHQDCQKILLIDFGLARKYRDKNGVHRPPRLLIKRQSRRDDLEYLTYTVAKLLKGTLPWSHLRTKNTANRERIAWLKANTTQALFLGYPEEFSHFFKYVRGLSYYEKPKYSYWQKAAKTEEGGQYPYSAPTFGLDSLVKD
ncbi:casein kinase 1-like protein 2 [Homarus americanus]|uniref:casein kinase 1-like protein 2 n=1 Tax=Homarus americanus TaxID=6706 RepID=UPI001C47A6C2|nr:casein kinase 1-like protein 2 [Homarus americanus]